MDLAKGAGGEVTPEMDSAAQIDSLEAFFEQHYYEAIAEQALHGKKYIFVDFNHLSQFDPDIAHMLLEDPENLLKAAELAIERFDIDNVNDFKVRFHNLPKSQEIELRNIRSKHIGKLIQAQGIVRQKTDVRPQVTSARFECPSCGNTINVLQLDTKFREPSGCSCGRKGKFRLMNKDLVDAQKIVLEEAPDDLEGGEQPKRMNIFLQQDLVSPISDKKTNPGSKIRITGVTKEVPIVLATGGKSTRFDLMIDTNYVEPIQEDFTELNISEEEIAEIKDLAKDPRVKEKIVESIAPSVYGHDKIKESLLLQMLGGVQKKRPDGVVTRGDIHILLIGDPGAGKSQLLKRVTRIAPKARFVSGKGASGAGLTASVVKDEFLRGWALEAGAIVLANRGICCIDELDKMTKEDRSAMHEALEQQTVTISKANIQATLRAETTVLAAANPKFGRFDPYEIISKQIDLPSTLINRFDLIFPIKDMPSEEGDDKLAQFILELHRDTEIRKGQVLETELIKKFISFARQTCKPRLTESAVQEIKKYYVKMRNSGSDDGGIQAIPINARNLEALVRLTEAHAKIRLAKEATQKDAREAIELVHFCLAQVGLDPETGKIDIDRITTGISASQRGSIHHIKEIINELEMLVGKEIPLEDIIRQAAEKGISEDKVTEVVEGLKRSGDLYSPRHGVISKI